MPCVTCPIDGCTWKLQELPEALAGCLVQQLTMHDKAVHSVTPVAANIKLKLDPPKLGIGASPEEWSPFKRQWDMYKKKAPVLQRINSPPHSSIAVVKS